MSALLALAPLAQAEVRADAPVVAAVAPVTLAAAGGERTALGPLQPSAAPVEQQRAEAAADGPEPGWRERLALLGAAFLALLFILRRQVAHRLGDSGARSPAPRQRQVVQRRTEPAVEASSHAGFMLSQFDNLPAADAAPPAPATPGPVLRSKPPRPPLQRKLPVARRKARWPARLRPPAF